MQLPCPDAVTIAAALATLDSDANNHAALSQANEMYIQACGDHEHGFILEYREGNQDSHFQSLRDDVSMEDTIRAFTLYAAGDSSWKAMFEWKPLDLSKLSSRGGWVIFVVAALIVIALLYLLKFTRQ